MTKIFRFIISWFFILIQQGLIIGIGLIVYSQNGMIWGAAVFALCVPMTQINKLTYKNIMKYGLINFMTMNADTSEIDVRKGDRWYDE